MAVKPANSRYHTFTFNGVRAADYGIYVTDVNVFNSAARDVEYIEIPGRDGAFALDRGRFQNISVVYKCAMTQDTDEDFATAISEFRNAIASTKGYKRLEDDIHTDEYRMGVFSKGLEAPTLNTKTATFEVTFDCKPQRFLKSGEIPRTIGGAVTNPQTKSGAVVSIDSDGGDKATSLVSTIEAVQAGSGDPSPTNVRAITGWTEAKVFDTGKNLADESTAIGFNAAVTVDGGYISVTKNASSNYPAAHINTYLRAGVTYTVSATCVQATAQAKLAIRDIAPSSTTVTSSASYSEDGQRKSVTYTPTKSGMYRVALFSCFGTADTGTAIFTDIQCEIGSTATAYEPYTSTTTTTALGRTVYGGTVDIVTGTLTVTHQVETFDGTESWGSEQTSGGLINYYLNLDNAGKMAGRQGGLLDDEMMCNWLAPSSSITTYSVYVNTTSKYLNCKCSSASDVTAFKAMLSTTPLVVVYPLATPQTYNLTTHEVELLAGQNNVWADTGDISITYGHDPNKLVNPTLFESSPLLQVWGYGDIGINDDTINIADDVIGDVTLWERPSTQWDQKGGITYSQSNLRSGDRITVSKGSRALIELDFPQGDIVNNVSHTVTGGDADKFSQIVDIIRESAAYIDVYYNVLTFLASSNSSETATIEVTIEHTPSGGSATVSTINCEFIITNQQISAEQHTYKMWISGKPTGNYSSVIREYKYGYRIERMTAYSTKSALGEPLYFDLDIGEAYKIEDGQTVSVNNAVSFPARLPVLKSGTNTITYENTVDQLKIVPRWWEV